MTIHVWLLINAVLLLMSCGFAGWAGSRREFVLMGLHIGFAVVWAISFSLRLFALLVQFDQTINVPVMVFR